MRKFPLVLVLAALPLSGACAAEDEGGQDPGGSAGSPGASGSLGVSGSVGVSGAGPGVSGSPSTGGAPGVSGSPSTGGTPGVSGSSSTAGTTSTAGAGMGGSTSMSTACGGVRAMPKMAAIENFDGMTQVLEWQLVNMAGSGAIKPAPTGSLTVMASNNGTNGTYAFAALASWKAMNRPCLDSGTYTGIKFTVTGDTTDLLFRVSTPATYPTAEGGSCADKLCEFAHYQKDVTAALAAGSATVAFTELMQPWANPSMWFKTDLVGLVFLTTDTNVAHKFTIDNIEFY